MIEENHSKLPSPEECEMIFKNIPNVIWESDNAGNTYFISSSVKNVLGYAPFQILSHEIQWFDIVHPQDLNQVKNQFNSFFSDDKKYDIEYRVKNSKGNWIWIHDVAFRAKRKDGKDVAIGAFSDITARKKSEFKFEESNMQYQILFETSLDSIFAVTQEFEILEANPSALKIFGAHSKEELFRYNPIIDLSPEYQPDGQKSKEKAEYVINECLKQGFFIFEWTHRKITGELFQSLISINAIKLKDKNIQYNLWIRDITNLKKAEKERVQMHKMEALSLLAGGIAHDFNNLLAIILGNLNLMQISDDLSLEFQELISEAEDASMKAKNLIEQLLNFSKLGAPMKNFHSLPSLIRETADFTNRGKGVIINYALSLDLWETKFDKIQISQVIQNLVLNAIQAMKDKGVINIRGSNTSIKNDEIFGLISGKYIKIEITDSGMGIPQEIITKIFDPYFTTKHDGTGLGLSICHSIIKKHGGILQVESEIGKGTKFSFYLPEYKTFDQN